MNSGAHELSGESAFRGAAEGSRISSVDVGSLCDTGRRRRANQDRCIHVYSDGGHHLFAVADGMGGHRAGEVAAQIVADTCADLLPTLSHEAGSSSCGRILHESNRRIRKQSATDGSMYGMGSTGTLLLLTPSGLACVAHVGDSRAYLVRKGQLRALTEDHSMVASLVRAYQLEPGAASDHPKRNELLRSLGSSDELEVDESCFALHTGDRFVLCSDGLWTVVSDAEILDAAQRMSPTEAARTLVELANARGGPDNITVQVIAPDLSDPVATAAVPGHRRLRRGATVCLILGVSAMALLLSWILGTQ